MNEATLGIMFDAKPTGEGRRPAPPVQTMGLRPQQPTETERVLILHRKALYALSVEVARITADNAKIRDELAALKTGLRSVTRVPRAEPEARKCWRCESVKPIETFGKRGSGHDYICKPCQRERSTERREARKRK